jgi:1-acyl-sn-glycerol-3-phosphate acyltransferase
MFNDKSYSLSQEDQLRINDAFEKLKPRYQEYKDPWGFDLEASKKAVEMLYPIYKHYFKVRVFGAENIKDQRYLVTSNHSGQVPIDGILVALAFLLEAEKPRVLRGMIERFLAALPFLGELTSKLGSILGDRDNATFLLEQDESLLIFPEGVRGISKNTQDYYKIQSFTKGFFRIALKSQTDILPIAVVGAEEMFPFVYHLKPLAKLFKLPSVPLSLNFLPLPSPIDIYIGEVYKIPDDISSDAPDQVLQIHIERIQKIIKGMVAKGLKNRREFFDDFRKPFSSYIREKNIKS